MNYNYKNRRYLSNGVPKNPQLIKSILRLSFFHKGLPPEQIGRLIMSMLSLKVL